MGKRRKRTYELSKEQKDCARREMELLLFSLGVDQQWGVREMCYLIQVLALPKKVNREEQLQELERRMAVYREKLGFGRVWTYDQLKRAFYAQNRSLTFRRPTPQPMTEEEAKAFGPSKLPTLDVRHVLRRKVTVDLPFDSLPKEPRTG